MNRQLRRLMVPLMCLGFLGCNGTEYNFKEKQEPLYTELDGGPGAPSVIGQPPVTCSTQLTELRVSAKVLFVVDRSGSNATENGVGTDKDKSYRVGSIQKFVDDYSMKQNFNWGLIGFNFSSADSYIGDGWTNPSMFSKSTIDIQKAIDAFAATADEGNTPYVAAIRKASDAIVQDVSVGSADTKYIVVFVSDGLPSPTVADSVVNEEISALMAKAPGRISFNTIYYGIPSEGGQVLMQSMANTGRGQFLDTNMGGAGRSFPISNVVQVPGVPCDRN